MKSIKRFIVFFTFIFSFGICGQAFAFMNGGFEEGFNFWVYGDNGLPSYHPWALGSMSMDPNMVAQPIEGIEDAFNGFDGEAGYEAFLSQDISVPAEGAILAYYDRIQFDSLDIPSNLPRIYELQIRDFNDNVLSILHHQEVFLNGKSYTDLGWQDRAYSLTDFAGQFVRVYIRLYIPETFTGPAQIEFDDFRLLPDDGSVNPNPIYGPGVSGCVGQDGLPLVGRQVILMQPDEYPLVTTTDIDGCYNFGVIIQTKTYDVLIRKPN